MKQRVYIFAVVFLFIGVVFSTNAQDIIVLKNGSMIEAKVTEISATEIRYKRFSHLDGPTIVVSINNVLSIRYENGTVEIFNAAPAQGAGAVPQAGVSQGGSTTPQLSQPSALQTILNALPAIPISGNNLKFQFGGDSWTARVNGENFSAGTLVFEETAEGGTLTLTQTHIWPGAAGRTAGRVASAIPGGGAAGNVLNTAGNVAGAAGPIEASGTIVLEYKAGPPASLRLVSVQSGNPESEKAKSSPSVELKFSMGGVIGIWNWKTEEVNTFTYNDSYYTNYYSYDATCLSLIQPILSLRLLFPFENGLRLGLGVDGSYSLVFIKLGGSANSIGLGLLPLYGIIGYNKAYLHVGYDFGLGGLFVAPSFTITENFMINIPISFLGNNNNFCIAKVIGPPDLYEDYGYANRHKKVDTKMFYIGITFQYVFGKRNTASQQTTGESASNANRYEVVNEPMSWEEAKLEAERRGGYLAVITSRAENTLVRDLITRQGNTDFYWLGGQADTSRRWSWVTGEPFSYANWSANNPDNAQGNQDKIAMTRTYFSWGINAGEWDDSNGSARFGFVIEYPSDTAGVSE